MARFPRWLHDRLSCGGGHDELRWPGLNWLTVGSVFVKKRSLQYQPARSFRGFVSQSCFVIRVSHL